jgi:hypothetical protein
MFQFTGFPPYRYVFAARYTRSARMGFPIQIPADHCPFAAPHRFSQLTASFFGSHCQGIRPALFVYLTKLDPLTGIQLRAMGIQLRVPQTFGLQTPLSSFQVYQLLLFSMASLSHSVGISPPSLLLLCCLFFFFCSTFISSCTALGCLSRLLMAIRHNQLLYRSISSIRFSRCVTCGPFIYPLMGLSGLEPPTLRLSGARSNQLSYKPRLFYSVHFP